MPTNARVPLPPGRQRPAPSDPERVDMRSRAKREDAEPLPATGSPVPPDAAGVLQLQRTLGNRAVGQLLANLEARPREETRSSRRSGPARVQRMIRIGAKLYFNGEAIKAQLPGKKSKDVELAQWRKNLVGTIGGDPTNAPDAFAIPGMNVASPTEIGALNNKLNSGSTIYTYASAMQMNGFLPRLRAGVPEDSTPLLLPKDMLDEEADLSMVYDQGKACVLQALINLGIELPQLAGGQQKDPKAWHTYYLGQGIQYDDDTVLYRIYTGFGFRLVWNQPTLWRNLSPKDVPPGEYVFATPGHNFAVIVKASDVPAERYQPIDKPQNMVTAYESERKINYVWQKP